MAFNVPSGTIKNLTFGPGIVFITTSAGFTPAIDLGYVRGATFSAQRNKLDVFQGSPRSYITTFAQEENVTLQVTGLEWNLTNLQLLMGSGDLSIATLMQFGGSGSFLTLSVMYRHITPSGGTVEINLYRCQGQGELSQNFNDDLQEFNYQFRALIAAGSDVWGGTTTITPSKGNLFSIRYIASP